MGNTFLVIDILGTLFYLSFAFKNKEEREVKNCFLVCILISLIFGILFMCMGEQNKYNCFLSGYMVGLGVSLFCSLLFVILVAIED